MEEKGLGVGGFVRKSRLPKQFARGSQVRWGKGMLSLTDLLESDITKCRVDAYSG